MLGRQKILMAVVQEMDGCDSDTQIQALLFLFCHHFVEHNHYYDFIPSSPAPLSLQAQEDKKPLQKRKLLQAGDGWHSGEKAKRFAVELDFFEKIALQRMRKQELHTWSAKQLTAYIAEHHPDFLSGGQQDTPAEPCFYTIGYEGITLESYINRLLERQVKLLCDVRKNAYSQKYGFTKHELQGALDKAGIAYHHMPELGIVSEKRQELNTDADYNALFDEYERTTLTEQQAALEELKGLAAQHGRIAITCFEAKPHQCHRSRIALHLRRDDSFTLPVEHIK